MREIPKVGERVTAPNFRGPGIVQRIRILRMEAVVKWRGGLITSVPLQDLELAPPAEANVTTASPKRLARETNHAISNCGVSSYEPGTQGASSPCASESGMTTGRRP